MSQMLTHCGAEDVSRTDLVEMGCPEGTDTWFPLPHGDVLTAVEERLDNAGFDVSKSRLTIAKDGRRFFGVLDIASEVVPGVSLSVGIRNSVDKSFPIGFCIGTRTFVCDNLAFSSEIVIAKRHTRFGKDRFNEGISQAIASLPHYQSVEAAKIAALHRRILDSDRANSVMLQAYEKGIVGARILPDLIHEWRHPQHEEFEERTAYSLVNAYTEVMKPRFEIRPQSAAFETMRFQKFVLTA